MGEPVHARILRILDGDREAISWLYDRFSVSLLRRLRLRFAGESRLDPDDLLHDTYVYLLSDRAGALRRFLDRAVAPLSEDSLGHFLWSAACGVASNRRRSQRRRPVVALEEGGSALVEAGVEEGALSRDLLERLAHCLRRRGPAHYLYFQLRYRGGLEPREIVEATGWSRKKTYKLKQALDEALECCAAELGLEP